MEFTGLATSQVLSVLGGFAAAVTVLYLLKLRRRQIEVPFVHLWQSVLAEKQTTRLFSALKRIFSWLVALAVVALLALAMGDPRNEGASDDGRTTVVLIDTSASMRATDVAPSRTAVATEHVRRMIEGLGGDDRMLIASMDASTVPLSPLTADPRVLRDGLGSLAATDVAADLNRGLRFALDVLRGQPRARIVIVSDGVLGDDLSAEDGPVAERLTRAGVEVDWIRIGVGGPNVAITAFSVRRYPLDLSRSEVLVELWNTGEDDASVELELLGDDQTIDVQRLRITAGERLRRFFTDVSGADRTLEARVRFADGSHDAQPADDRAFARLPERRRARVMAVTGGNLYLSAALLLDEYLDVVEVAPADYPAEGRFDVTIFDSWVPPSPPETDAIYLYPHPGGTLGDDGANHVGPFEVTGLAERPFFDRIEHRHPLVAFTALGDVNIAEALVVELEENDRVVGGDRGVPLLVTGSRNDQRIVALLFDVRRSDLPLRVAWPLLLLNAIDGFTQEDAAYHSSYETGETWHVPVPADAEEATLITPGGGERQVPVVDGRAVCGGDRAGFYTVRAGGVEALIAANVGPSDEAVIEPAENLTIAGREATPPTIGAPGVRTEIWMLLVGLALGVLLVEWITYHRRMTV